MDKKGLKDKGSAVMKALKELEAAFETSDPKTRIEMTGYAKELSSKLKEAGKHFTVESRFRILKKRGRPSGSTKTAKPAAKKALPKRTATARPAVKKPATKKPTAKIAAGPAMDHPELSHRPN